MAYSNYNDLEDKTWIGWFLNLHVNRFLCRVPIEYIEDKFNLTGLEQLVPSFHQTLNAILHVEFDTEYDFNPIDANPELTAQLYGMIHARYILSMRGIDDMCIKYQRGDFGICPRTYCDGQLVLPVGLFDRIGEANVKIYCPRCRDVYQPNPRCSPLDGAMFGSSFPHMFFMQLPHLLPEPSPEKYTPRIYGFKLHESAMLPPQIEPVIDNTSSNININNNNNNKSNPNSNISSSISSTLLPIVSPPTIKLTPISSPTISPPLRRFNFTIN